MKHISILVPETAIIEAVADPHYLFNAINQFMIESGKQPMFQVDLVAARKEITLNDRLYSVHPNRLIADVRHTDLIFIPAISGDIKSALERNKELVPWIVEQHQGGAEVASLCIGAFLLASTGLLHEKKCSTHWNAANQFRTMFPDVNLVDDGIITDENRIYTSGGANSYWSLLLYLVEKYTDRSTAIQAAKYFAIDMDRINQAAFMLFKGQKEHGDEAVMLAQEYIECHYSEKMSIDDLASLVHLGRRTFERRFKNATNNTVAEYIQRVKMEAVKRSLEQGKQSINEVMYQVGYSDTKAFRLTFKKVTGLTPVAYKLKYTKREQTMA